MTPVYSTSALVRIAQVQDSNVSYYDLNYAERLMHTYAYLLTSEPFLKEVIQRLDLDVSSQDLSDSIKVEVIPNTELLELSAESADPAQTAEIVNTLGILLVEQREDLYTGQGRSSRELLEDQLTVIEENLAEDRKNLQTLIFDGTDLEQDGIMQDLSIRIQVQEDTYAMLLEQYDNALLTEAAFANSISIVQPATIPDSPIRPHKLLNIVLGTLVGFLGGLGLGLLFENIDSAIYSTEELETAAKLPILASVPRLRHTGRSNHRPILLIGEKHSSERESFRILRTNIDALVSNNRARSIMITSAEQGTGKSTILVNLAIAMAHAGRNIVIIDSNLRKPCMHETFGLPNDLGLSTIVTDPDQLSPNLWLAKTKFPRISLLSSGPLPSNPTERLGSQQMQKILSELVSSADMVLLDSPATLNYADAATIASMVDGVVFVASRGKTSRRDVQKALQQMEKVRASLLGVVFNRADDANGAYKQS
jgi:succinoglycan biosynthesis transport protein ExoP